VADAVDSVVVGAGLAGLSAARALTRAGASCVVLEARDRVGGRTFSERTERGVIDLGGQWLGPTQERMRRLVAELGIAMFPTHHEGHKVLELGGQASTYRGEVPALAPHKLLLMQLALSRLDALAARVPLAEPWRAPAAERWDATTVESWSRRIAPLRDVRAVMDVAVRSVFGAEPGELSLLHFLAYLRAGGGLMSLVGIENGAQQDRFVDGAQTVAQRLAAALGARVVLGAPVRAIRRRPDGVDVASDAGTWHGRRVIVAVPPVLAGRIAYDPPLPALRDQLTQRMPMGATIKCHALYERPFWRELGFSGEAVSDGEPVSAVFDNTSHDGAQPALLGFIVGRPARIWSGRDPVERREAVLAAYARFFGPEAARPMAYVEKDWSVDPWAGGCPVGSMTPGTMSLFGPALRAPVERIHWAGTETAIEWTGYMEGAVESGERAAREVVARL
jgi:monoamine oxidase